MVTSDAIEEQLDKFKNAVKCKVHYDGKVLIQEDNRLIGARKISIGLHLQYNPKKRSDYTQTCRGFKLNMLYNVGEESFTFPLDYIISDKPFRYLANKRIKADRLEDILKTEVKVSKWLMLPEYNKALKVDDISLKLIQIVFMEAMDVLFDDSEWYMLFTASRAVAARKRLEAKRK